VRASTAGPALGGSGGSGGLAAGAPALAGHRDDLVDLSGVTGLVHHRDEVAILAVVLDGVQAVVSVSNSHHAFHGSKVKTY
jgi:hypothetical protein